MRHRSLLLSCLLFCLAVSAWAQPTFTLHGVISKRLSVERVSQVIVTNLRSKDFIASDELGWFAIKAAIGDTLLFTKKDYTDQKIAITSSGDMPVYMQPVIQLNGVTIQGQTKKQELNDVMNDYRKQGTFYNGKPPALSFITNPLTGLYELFGTTPGRAKRFAANSQSEIEYAAVRRRYTPALVKRVTNAGDSTVRQFMEYYTPSYEDIKTWNDYELIREIKKSYEYYDNNKERIPLQSLNGQPLIKNKE